MPLFRYKVLTETGTIQSGIIDLPQSDPLIAARYLEHSGNLPLHIAPLPQVMDTVLQKTGFGIGTLSRLELVEFYNNMGMLVGAGVTVLDALDEIAADTKNQRLKNAILCIRSDIQTGQTLGEALERQPLLAPFVVLHMVQIGEETGQLDAMLKKAAEHIRNIHDIISATKRALTYPAFLLAVVFLAVVFWFWYVVPQLVSLFQEMGIELPAPTRLLLAIADWFQAWFLPTLAGAVLLAMVLAWLRRRFYPVRYGLSALALRLPVLSTILHTAIVARATEYLGIMIGSGINIVRTLDMIIAAIANEVYRERLQGTLQSIKSGTMLSESLRRNQALDPFAVRMLAVGEMTGRLDDQAEYVAELYRNRLKGLVDVLSKTLEPTIMIFLGGMFALIMVGLLLPVYDLISKMGG